VAFTASKPFLTNGRVTLVFFIPLSWNAYSWNMGLKAPVASGLEENISQRRRL
jgi:hypothetical protein